MQFVNTPLHRALFWKGRPVSYFPAFRKKRARKMQHKMPIPKGTAQMNAVLGGALYPAYRPPHCKAQ